MNIKLSNMKLEESSSDFQSEKENILLEENNQNTKILCKHCKRTNENGIRCQGICVSDNEY